MKLGTSTSFAAISRPRLVHERAPGSLEPLFVSDTLGKEANVSGVQGWARETEDIRTGEWGRSSLEGPLHSKLHTVEGRKRALNRQIGEGLDKKSR